MLPRQAKVTGIANWADAASVLFGRHRLRLPGSTGAAHFRTIRRNLAWASSTPS